MYLPKDPNIIYLSQTFPSVTTTFELNEIYELERSGCKIELFSLKRPCHTIVHNKARSFVSGVTYASPISLWKGMSANLYFLFSSPLNYLEALFLHIIFFLLPYHYHEVSVFIKSVYLAKIM